MRVFKKILGLFNWPIRLFRDMRAEGHSRIQIIIACIAVFGGVGALAIGMFAVVAALAILFYWLILVAINFVASYLFGADPNFIPTDDPRSYLAIFLIFWLLRLLRGPTH